MRTFRDAFKVSEVARGEGVGFLLRVVVTADSGEGFGVFQQGGEAVVTAGLNGHDCTSLVLAALWLLVQMAAW